MSDTPLRIAALENHCAVAEVLLHFGADINAVNNEGATPLHYANHNKRAARPPRVLAEAI